MYIHFIFTGGTIGSTAGADGVIGTDASKPEGLLALYRSRYGMDISYRGQSPYTILSERLDGTHLSRLVAAVREAQAAECDGVIVTVGTDTLQYVAAALGYCCGNRCKPTVLVSADRPVEDPLSNGLANLHGAVTLIGDGAAHGVYVTYRNPGESAVRVHRATRLLDASAYDDGFHSLPLSAGGDDGGGSAQGSECAEGGAAVAGALYGDACAEGGAAVAGALYSDEGAEGGAAVVGSVHRYEREDETPPLDAAGLNATAAGICRLRSYPGLWLGEPMVSLPSGTEYLLLESYHSGTIDDRAPALSALLADADRRGVAVLLTGVWPGRCYESMTAYAEAGIHVLPMMSPAAAYVKLWLLSHDHRVSHAARASILRERVISQMRLSLGGDIVASSTDDAARADADRRDARG